MKQIIGGAVLSLAALTLAIWVLRKAGLDYLLEGLAFGVFVFITLPLTLPWPRWFVGGVLAIGIPFGTLWGVHLYESMQPDFDQSIDGALIVGIFLLWTIAFGIGVGARLLMRLMVHFLRNSVLSRDVLRNVS